MAAVAPRDRAAMAGDWFAHVSLTRRRRGHRAAGAFSYGSAELRRHPLCGLARV